MVHLSQSSLIGLNAPPRQKKKKQKKVHKNTVKHTEKNTEEYRIIQALLVKFR